MNEELMKKAKQASSPEELLNLAKAEHIELSEQDAISLFAQLHGEGELLDDELDTVAGGGCGSTNWVGDNSHVVLLRGNCCPNCSCTSAIYITQRFYTDTTKQFFRCDGCGQEFYLCNVSTVNGKDMLRG